MQSQSLAPRRWWYIIPIVFVTYSLAYLDRANYGLPPPPPAWPKTCTSPPCCLRCWVRCSFSVTSSSRCPAPSTPKSAA